MKMRLVSNVMAFVFLVLGQVEAGAAAGSTVSDPGSVESLEQQMMSDPAIMALILSLQEDQGMKSLLADPAVAAALQAGDLETLMNDPRFRKLLDDPRVREIENKVR